MVAFVTTVTVTKIIRVSSIKIFDAAVSDLPEYSVTHASRGLFVTAELLVVSLTGRICPRVKSTTFTHDV